MKATLEINGTDVTLEGDSDDVTDAVERLTDEAEYSHTGGYDTRQPTDSAELRERIRNLQERISRDSFIGSIEPTDSELSTIAGVPVVTPTDPLEDWTP